MCTIAFAWQVLADAPIAVAANRDEALDRESLPPRVLESDPEVVAPQDGEAGGTWIGVTERGLFVAITNRWTDEGPPDLPAERSRGLLVRDTLRCESTEEALALVREEIADRDYAGFNLLVADADRAVYCEWDGELRVRDLDPGVHVIVNPGIDAVDGRALRLRDALAIERAGGGGSPTADANVGQAPAAETNAELSPSAGDGRPIETGAVPSAADWLDDAASLLGDHEYDVCVHREGFGTRSSSLVSIDWSGRATYDFADGPPCETEYRAVACPAAFLDRRD